MDNEIRKRVREYQQTGKLIDLLKLGQDAVTLLDEVERLEGLVASQDAKAASTLMALERCIDAVQKELARIRSLQA